jgi:RNA polymerase sigma factor (sigma-70 family)
MRILLALAALAMLLAALARADVLGERRLAVRLVTWGPEPVTLADAQEAVAETDAFIRANSFGKTWLSADVAGWTFGWIDRAGPDLSDGDVTIARIDLPSAGPHALYVLAGAEEYWIEYRPESTSPVVHAGPSLIDPAARSRFPQKNLAPRRRRAAVLRAERIRGRPRGGRRRGGPPPLPLDRPDAAGAPAPHGEAARADGRGLPMTNTAMALVPPGEAELVERARRGDHDAYEALMREHERAAFRTAYLIVGSAADAEDVAQEAFVKAYRALGRFRAGSPFRPWLLRIVGNEARNHRRAAGRRAWHQGRAGALEPVASQAGADAELLRREERRRLLAAVDALPEGERVAVAARYFAGLTDGEIGAALGLPRAAVKMRAWRGLQRLRNELGEEG